MTTRDLERLNGVRPLFVNILKEAYKDCPYKFSIPRDGGVRTTKRQQEIYAYGRTDMSKSIRTYADGIIKKSKHQVKLDGYGHAVDFYHVPDGGGASWNKIILKIIARHIQKVALEKFDTKVIWGGDWKMKDYPHLQL